jgi:Pyruvate/2-oxoacid:ferredoxin oxidoreductase delta subunit
LEIFAFKSETATVKSIQDIARNLRHLKKISFNNKTDTDFIQHALMLLAEMFSSIHSLHVDLSCLVGCHIEGTPMAVWDQSFAFDHIVAPLRDDLSDLWSRLSDKCRGALQHFRITKYYQPPSYRNKERGFLAANSITSEIMGISSFLSRCGDSLKTLHFQTFSFSCDVFYEMMIASNCQSLQIVDVTYQCGSWTHSSGSWTHSCVSLTDQIIESLVVSNKHLIRLILGPQIELTGKSLSSIGTHCPLLIELNVSENNHFSDDSVVQLSIQCNKLKCVDFSYCVELTMVAFDALKANCEMLVYLFIRGCGICEYYRQKHERKYKSAFIGVRVV